jgi:hypothetical protein
MTAMNVVHMRVRPGREADFIEAEKKLAQTEMPGLKKFSVVKTGDRQYIIVGEWESFDAIVEARTAMIGSLDTVRDMLEDLGGGRGVTEPYSGDVVVEIPGS